MSRGNREGRPLPTGSQLADMGYKPCIDAITTLLVSFHPRNLSSRHSAIAQTFVTTGDGHESRGFAGAPDG
jgi:hypothetical protein